MIRRRYSKTVRVGRLLIGGQAPVVIQSMNNTDTRNVEATLSQIRQLAEAGCALTRVAVPDMEAAEALAKIRRSSPLPIVADIHFDYRLALAAIESGADKIRINPGNIGGADRVRQVAESARAHGIPIRVGVNSGSLSRAMLDRYQGINARSMVASALEAVAMLEAVRFTDLVISIKASDPLLTIESYRLLADKTDYPLHVGVTEAGTRYEGVIRSSVGIGALLAEGIGDTIRVSLTADPVEEVRAARAILRSLALTSGGPRVISCPTCGRTEVDLQRIAEEVENRLQAYDCPIEVAVMGCAVNGPGEAAHADVGIAGGKGEFLIFSRGDILRKVPQAEAVEALMAEIDKIILRKDNQRSNDE
ncbi:MAG: flavodoxin-dependent (E)-4-hydroxy-3-methylbut-2-enyl-diphosphate synthase [Clostridiaceae bacterium]|nr:flavodoxin-dependent (E)-4-hydroxy-3-methylbut-2-enyl-diphosphate synthase [Clostridiaceae bacterium]